jgi:hypothetical protein
MTLSDLAAIGSFVSGVAVVVSLITLTLQIRQNTKALRRTEENATQNQFSVARMAIVTNRDVASLWAAGMSGVGELDAVDELRFAYLMSDLMWSLANTWESVQQGAFGMMNWDQLSTFAMEMLSSARARQLWSLYKHQYPTGFVQAVDRVVAAQGAAVPIPSAQASSRG